MIPVRPQAGDKAPEMTVLDSEGNSFSLSAKYGSGRNSLVVFYRGHW